jgi:hypothetical protein
MNHPQAPFQSLLCVTLICISAVLSQTARASADVYTCHTVDVPGAAATNLWHLNNLNQIAAATDQGGFVYEPNATASFIPLPAPPPASGFVAANLGVESINDSGVVVGSAFPTSGLNVGFILSSVTNGSSYQFVPAFTGGNGPNLMDFRANNNQGLITVDAASVNTGDVLGLIYNPTATTIAGFNPGYTPYTPTLSNGSLSDLTISGGINSNGWFVGSASSDTTEARGFLSEASTSTFHFLPGSSNQLRGINDQDPNSSTNCTSANCLRLSGFGLSPDPGGTTGAFYVDFDPATATFQTPHPIDCSTLPAGIHQVILEGINNENVITGFYLDAANTEHGLIAYPNVQFPFGIINGAFMFNFPATANATVFLDPAIASGYAYATGPGNPAFQSVTLPIGIGSNNKYSLIVEGFAFSLAAGRRFDFTKTGFPAGVTAFTVIGIDPGAAISTTNSDAFVTAVSFVSSGEFTGLMTPLTTATQAANGGVSTCADLSIIKASFGAKVGQAGYRPLADANGDGVINILDLSFASRLLPPGTVCN